MPKFRLEYLFTRYLQQNINAEEQEELMRLIADIGNEAEVLDVIEGMLHKMDASAEIELPLSDKILHNILDAASVKPTVVKPFFKWRLSIAAGLIAITLVSVLWFVPGSGVGEKKELVDSDAQIKPGSTKAFLKRDDGAVVMMNTGCDTAFGSEDECNSFDDETTSVSGHGFKLFGRAGYNTLVTPRGGRFKISLPDGSKVWLNAASSIRYPLVFDDERRVVELTGEAYFKIKRRYGKDKKTRVPFIVNIKSSSGDSAMVKVLGTTFNVNAHENQEMFEVTLKQGAVEVEKGSKTQLLQPGEQARVYDDNRISMIRDADVDAVVCWKEGVFSFENQDIKTIMSEVARWYDVNVSYKMPVSTARFDGKISRNADIREVLEILKLSGVQFNIDHKTIFVQ